MFRFFTVATYPLEQNPDITAFLGHHVGAHGTELRLRDPHDRTADIHASSLTLLHQRCKFFHILFDL